MIMASWVAGIWYSAWIISLADVPQSGSRHHPFPLIGGICEIQSVMAKFAHRRRGGSELPDLLMPSRRLIRGSPTGPKRGVRE